MGTDFNKSWKKACATTDEAVAVRILAEILSSKDGRRFALGLSPAEAKLCIEILDQGLGENFLRGSEKQGFLSTLRRLSGKNSLLPDSMVITDEIDYSGCSQTRTSGGFADVKQGKYNGHTVAVKTLRVAQIDDLNKIRKQFCQEAIIWNSLSHPNILKLVGVLGGIDKYRFATVSGWMENGNIMQYIAQNATNRLELLHGAAEGLEYLHDANLIHGDLKGDNILMTNHEPPRACLADFGFVTMVLDPENPMSCSAKMEGGTVAFMAPELLAPSKFGLKKHVPSQEGDIYAFGLVILQVLTGEIPFCEIKPMELAFHISNGVQPNKPENAREIGLSGFLWDLIQECLKRDRSERPRVREVVGGVKNAADDWHRCMPPSVPRKQEDSTLTQSDDLAHIEMFRSYESEEPPTPGTSSTETLGPARAKKSMTGDPEDLTYNHLSRNHPPPPSAIPPKKRKGFKHYLNKIPAIFGRKSKQ